MTNLGAVGDLQEKLALFIQEHMKLSKDSEKLKVEIW